MLDALQRRLLCADFGADALLIEAERGHPPRAESPFLDGVPASERSLLHAAINASKRSVVLREDARDRCNDLPRDTDLLRSADPSFQIPAAQQRREPIQISVTPYGLESPLAGEPGNNLTAYALSGWASLDSILVAQYAGAPAPRHRRDFLRERVPCRDGFIALTLSRGKFWRDAMHMRHASRSACRIGGVVTFSGSRRGALRGRHGAGRS